jgi:hypothetical protein
MIEIGGTGWADGRMLREVSKLAGDVESKAAASGCLYVRSEEYVCR